VCVEEYNSYSKIESLEFAIEGCEILIIVTLRPFQV